MAIVIWMPERAVRTPGIPAVWRTMLGISLWDRSLWWLYLRFIGARLLHHSNLQATRVRRRTSKFAPPICIYIWQWHEWQNWWLFSPLSAVHTTSYTAVLMAAEADACYHTLSHSESVHRASIQYHFSGRLCRRAEVPTVRLYASNYAVSDFSICTQ